MEKAPFIEYFVEKKISSVRPNVETSISASIVCFPVNADRNISYLSTRYIYIPIRPARETIVVCDFVLFVRFLVTRQLSRSYAQRGGAIEQMTRMPQLRTP